MFYLDLDYLDFYLDLKAEVRLKTSSRYGGRMDAERPSTVKLHESMEEVLQ